MAASFDETVAELGEVVEACRRAKHRAGYFAALYRRTTRAVRSRAEAGHFEDPERMERFVAAFAQRYLAAYRAWRDGEPTTASWEVALQTSASSKPIVLQHLVLGMSAHINLDLGIVAAELGRTAPGGLAGLRADFDHVNDVLSDELDASQANVNRVSPFMRLADGFGLRTDEELCRFALRFARTDAWAFAEHLAQQPPAEWAATIEERDAAVAGLGRGIVRPGGTLGLMLAVVRAGEVRSVPKVVTMLSA